MGNTWQGVATWQEGRGHVAGGAWPQESFRPRLPVPSWGEPLIPGKAGAA